MFLSARISFQLTSPNLPPADLDIGELTEYMEGRGSPPNFVREDLAVTAAMLLSGGMSNVWLNTTTRPSNYITRRFV